MTKFTYGRNLGESMENDRIYIWQKFRKIDGKWPNLRMTEI